MKKQFKTTDNMLFFILKTALLSGYSAVALAGQFISYPGGAMPIGQVADGQQLSAVTGNPAACHKVLTQDDTFRASYFGAVGVYIEVGDIDNFEDQVNDLVDLIDGTSVETLETLEEVTDDFNAVILELGRSGYLKVSGDVGLPLLPLALTHDVLGGHLCLDLGIKGQAKGSVLSEVLNEPIISDPNNIEFSTPSALMLKSGVLKQLGISYSRPVFHSDHLNYSGDLILGARFNYYSMELSRQVIAFQSFENDDVGDVIKDQYNENQNSSSEFGLDFGAIWLADRYQLGLTLHNINEPTFDFGVLGEECPGLLGDAYENCSSAKYFINRGDITAGETHRMESLLVVDGAWYFKPNWIAGFSYDLADYNDPVGDELQYFNLGSSFYPSNRWVPAIRFGYRKNLAGESLSSILLGTTLLKVVNIDFQYGLDSTKISGSSRPRNAGISLSLQQSL